MVQNVVTIPFSLYITTIGLHSFGIQFQLIPSYFGDSPGDANTAPQSVTADVCPSASSPLQPAASALAQAAVTPRTGHLLPSLAHLPPKTAPYRLELLWVRMGLVLPFKLPSVTAKTTL